MATDPPLPAADEPTATEDPLPVTAIDSPYFAPGTEPKRIETAAPQIPAPEHA